MQNTIVSNKIFPTFGCQIMLLKNLYLIILIEVFAIKYYLLFILKTGKFSERREDIMEINR